MVPPQENLVLHLQGPGLHARQCYPRLWQHFDDTRATCTSAASNPSYGVGTSRVMARTDIHRDVDNNIDDKHRDIDNNIDEHHDTVRLRCWI
jgi:hypothetical protein